MNQFDRITQRPRVMGGKACILAMRVTVGITVGNVVRQIGAGRTCSPRIKKEQIFSCSF
jgi:uncharacterized protein (DUF433 family)